MALIAKVGRKNAQVRIGIALMYFILCIGGITMVYPYLVTLTSAMTNELDYERHSPYPKYWFNREERYLKFLAEKYSDVSRMDFFKSAYGAPSHWGTFRDVAFERDVIPKCFPWYGCEKDPVRLLQLERIAKDYAEFMEKEYATRRAVENVVPLFLSFNLPDYQAFVQERYEGIALESPEFAGKPSEAFSSSRREKMALEALGRTRGDIFRSFFLVNFDLFRNNAYDIQKWIPSQNPQNLDFLDWVQGLPPESKIPVTRQYIWARFLLDAGWDARKHNEEAGTKLTSICQAPYPAGDAAPAIAELRDRFLRERWPVRLVRVKGDHREGFIAMMQERYPTIETLNKITGSHFKSWDEIPWTPTLPYPPDDQAPRSVPTMRIDAIRAVWRDYVLTLPAEEKEMRAPEEAYQDFLTARYGSVARINEAYGWSCAATRDILIPIPQVDYFDYCAHAREYLWKFATFNFGQVLKFMATKGRAFLNTLILVALTIFSTLTVNPLAAYALSRFQMRSTGRILIFLLATMAFPAEVGMIPSFLLLRDLSLLNTFGALVLPGLASGFSIFLLKGFFDSLPRELYEAASIDGAGEIRMFTTITLPLCKPILAVIALGAFIAAYGGFMWAFLVCQDERMWTIMVWLYQFQAAMDEAVKPFMTMAALVVASIPTLLVFMFCQKIILRGIIIPTMK